MHSDYQDIISLEHILQAWEEFKRGKTRRADVQLFERHLEDNLFMLHQDLKEKTYKSGAYQSFYVRDPKIRHIHKAVVRDRVVHHLVSKLLEKVFEPTFYTHSYSCRKEKGTHKAIQTLIKMARKASKNNTSSLFALKCDVKKFFASVDHEILLELVCKKVKDPNLCWLLGGIIASFQSEFTINPLSPKGMPIGNLTSQLFANIYMDPLDQFIKHELKVKYYLRYADDFVILSDSKDQLEKLRPLIEEFLRSNLKFSLHPDKVIIRDYYLGIDFLGYIVFPHFVLPRTKTKRRIFKKVHQKVQLVKSQKLTPEQLNQTIQSYLGYLSHCNAFKLSQDLKNKVWFWLTD